MEVDKAFSLYFQHLLEALVEEVYEIMQSEFIYKKGGLGKFATLRDRLADPVHGSAIKTFKSSDELESRLPTEFWVKRNLRELCDCVDAFIFLQLELANMLELE